MKTEESKEVPFNRKKETTHFIAFCREPGGIWVQNFFSYPGPDKETLEMELSRANYIEDDWEIKIFEIKLPT